MVLFRGHRFFNKRILRSNLRQALVVVIHNGVVAAFFVDPHKPVKQNNLSCGAQAYLAVGAANFNRGALHPGGFHLARNCALPDQVIEFFLIAVGDIDLVWRLIQLCWANTFMRFLRIFSLVFINTW